MLPCPRADRLGQRYILAQGSYEDLHLIFQALQEQANCAGNYESGALRFGEKNCKFKAQSEERGCNPVLNFTSSVCDGTVQVDHVGGARSLLVATALVFLTYLKSCLGSPLVPRG